MEKETKIFVTFGPSDKNLLGRYTAFGLGILKNIHQIENKQSTPQGETVPANEDVKHASYFEMRKFLTPLSRCEQILEECTLETQRKEHLMEKQSVTKSLVEKLPEIFRGIGKHKYRTITLNIDQEIKPVIQPQRRIPFAKREKLNKVLNELEREGAIENVEGPTEWISNLVLTPKADPDEIRMNIMTTPNAARRKSIRGRP